MTDGDAGDTGCRVYDVTSFRSRASDERDDAGCDGAAHCWSVRVRVAARPATAQRVRQPSSSRRSESTLLRR